MSRDFEQVFGQIVSIRIKTLGNTNMVALRLSKREKGSLSVDVLRPKTSLPKLPIFSVERSRRGLNIFSKTESGEHPCSVSLVESV